MAAFADRLLEYFDSGAGPIPGPYGIDELGNDLVPVTPDIVVDSNPTAGALSLPTNSSVTVGFTNVLIQDQSGNDISVLELENAGEQEQAGVYVSSNNSDFVFLGTASTGTASSFDLASVGFTSPVEAVRIVGLDNGGLSPGFDVANVQALQPALQVENLTALQPEWNSENRSLRYGFEVENANDLIAQNVEVELYFSEREFRFPLGTQDIILGEIPVTNQTNPEIIGNQIWYDLPVEEIPLELTDQELEAERILAIVDPNNLISETDETDNDLGVEYFFVRNIPQIMRNRGEEWEVPASFQERWLNGEATVLTPPPDEPDFEANPTSELISLDWILQDTVDTDNRAQKAFNQLIDTDYLFTDGGRDALIDKLIPKLALAPEGEFISFGVEGTGAAALDDQQTQYIPVEPNSRTPIDPLTGALGAFSFYAIPIGEAQQVENEIEVTVTDVGIYALDIFEFNGRQFLGNWEPPDQVSLNPLRSGTNVFNGTYRDYREQTGLGEDFNIVSTVEEITFPSPFTFTEVV